jgi:hypothetical protein
MAFTVRAFAKVVKKRFDLGEVGGLRGESVNGAQTLGIDIKQNQSAFGAAQVSREDHVE